MTQNSYICNLIKNNPDTWLNILENKKIKVKTEGDLAIFNYDINADFFDPIVKEARGIIININTLDVVCWPFTKFGNSHEPYADEIDWDSALGYEKIDGSIIKYWFDHNKDMWRWSTNSCIDASDAKTMSGESFLDLIKKTDEYDIYYASQYLSKYFTYIFELVGPDNQVVVKYDKPKLFHIGTRNNTTGKELNAYIGIDQPAVLKFDSLEDTLKYIKNMNKNDYPEHEGFVVVDKNFHRIKVKTPEYLLYHHMVNNGIMTKEKVFEIVNSDDVNIEEFVKSLSDKNLKLFRYYLEQITEVRKNIEQNILYALDLKELGLTRKEMALIIKDNPYASYMFKALDNGHVSENIDASGNKLLKFIKEYEPVDIPFSKKRPNFIMPVGLPGCGKSTYARLFQVDHDINIISSDEIRKELGFDAGKGNNVVFDEMLKRTKESLNNGESVIYDATNLSRKNRINLLNQLKNLDIEKTCLLFTDPVSEVKRRNDLRTGFSHVSDRVYDHMLRSFQVPIYREGFNNIEQIQTIEGERLSDIIEKTKDFDQDNSHHDLTLYEHLLKTKENVRFIDPDDIILKDAAFYHDIGKLYTKTFHDARGNETSEAHYYGHENVGTYMYLSSPESKELPLNERLKVAVLINQHMRPYLQMKDSKREAENTLLGPIMSDRLKNLHKADSSAHNIDNDLELE